MIEPPRPPLRLSDERVDRILGAVLQAGVIIAGTIVSVAGVVYLARHGTAPPLYGAFRGEPENLRTVSGILRGVGTMQARPWIQLGLLVLLLTPVVRVALLLGAFILQRDRLYVAIAAIVLSLLLLSLTGRVF